MKNIGLKAAAAIILILLVAGVGLYLYLHQAIGAPSPLGSRTGIVERGVTRVANAIGVRSPFPNRSSAVMHRVEGDQFLCEPRLQKRQSSIDECEQDGLWCAGEIAERLRNAGQLPSTMQLKIALRERVEPILGHDRKATTGADAQDRIPGVGDAPKWLVTADTPDGPKAFHFDPCQTKLDAVPI